MATIGEEYVGGEEYVELLAPVFVEKLGGVSLMRSGSIEDRATLLSERVLPGVRKADWPSANLPDKIVANDDDEGTHIESAGVYAEGLTRAAFEDAASIMRQCKRFVESTDDTPTWISFGQLLLNSKKTLLKVAEIPNPDAEGLHRSLKNPVMSTKYMGAPLVGKPFVYSLSRQGDTRVAWSPQIDTWIESKKKDNRGCPASKTVIENRTGHKQLLTHYLWDAMVRATFPI